MAMKRSHAEMSSPSQSSPSSKANGHPKISRKIRACKECQSRKIRCDMGPGERICNRCQRLGLNCIVNKSLQTLLEDENEWKSTVEGQLSQLRAAVSEVLRRSNLPEIGSYASPSAPGSSSGAPPVQHPSQPIDPILDPEIRAKLQSHVSPQSDRPSPNVQGGPPGMAMTRENSQEPPIQGEAAVVAPMASLFEVTRLRNLRSNLDGRAADVSPMENDFISQGKISEQEAEELFKVFRDSLNHYLWGGIALVHDSLKSVRASSSQLLAAILAVTALHIPHAEQIFDTCYAEFLSLVSTSMFDRYHSLDDVRALCIGAFWLSDVSWKLSGHAVRIGTELNLHQSFHRAMRGSESDLQKARLWYLLYVCDHHFSIAYSRPPVTPENEAITFHESFLQLPGITQADFRIQSQVGLFLILSRIFHTFGTDPARTLTEEDLDLVGKYNADLDNWRSHWEPLLAPNERIATYPARGVTLHCNFAKVQLNALVLRGFQANADSMTENRRHFANLAISSAVKTLEVVVDEPDISRSVVGVPLYLTTLISFSSVFLIKMQLTWKNLHLNIDTNAVMTLLERVVSLLQGKKASERHLAGHIAVGLSNIITKLKNRDLRALSIAIPAPETGSSAQGPQPGLPLVDLGTWPQMSVGNGMYNDVMDFYALDEQYFPPGIFDALPIPLT